ncbi:ATP-binding protein [Rhabdochromatium marinum]|uniref:sensor histidine kinase n=1 Tax=Rhabdochromatium marinum TaxID=48729 RepID=UPI001903C9A6|nr:ATP-binding protein [Rhabdochromatium marinum]MBK1649617.1 hypothetical protein [Rhabdochromatium marinum]
MRIDYFSTSFVPDEFLLSALLDFLMTSYSVDAYCFRFIPQIGHLQGRPVRSSRSRNCVPPSVLAKAWVLVDTFDTSIPIPRTHTSFREENFFVHHVSIAGSYTINIGCVALVSKSYISPSRLNRILDTFEDFLAFRKHSVALSYQADFLKLDIESRELLDEKIGEIVHSAVSPNETLILKRSKNTPCYDVSYSSSGASFSIPQKRGPMARCFESGESVSINDVNDRKSIINKFGRYFSNPEFLKRKGYLSCLFFPVKHETTCYCVIACFFSRKNAVSNIEKKVLDGISDMLGDYYRIWYEKAQIRQDLAESGRILKHVRQSLLIADIMHDATQDLVTANAQLGLLHGKNDAEENALHAAKDTLKSLIIAARHFRNFFNTNKAKTSADIAIKRVVPKQHYETIRPCEITADIFAKYHNQMIESKITPQNNCSATLEFKGIRYNVSRALDNAIRNSIDQLRSKTHVSRQITVSAVKRPGQSSERLAKEFIEIDVFDNGPGVEPDNLERISQPFVSLRGGMGLGIPIIQAACETHGGLMELRSNWGKDFHVIMKFPLSP